MVLLDLSVCTVGCVPPTTHVLSLAVVQQGNESGAAQAGGGEVGRPYLHAVVAQSPKANQQSYTARGGLQPL